MDNKNGCGEGDKGYYDENDAHAGSHEGVPIINEE